MTRQELIAGLPKGLRCAELGVFGGFFARDILRLMRPNGLYLVDTFDGMFTSADQDGANRMTLHLPTVEMLLRAEFRNEPGVTVVKADSVAWLISRPDDSLDFVYIDTTHSYERTRAEIAEAWRVVREGGWMAGHDYHDWFPGVIQAVDEVGWPVTLTQDGLPSWLVQNRK